VRHLLCISLVSALTVGACTGSLFHSNAPSPSTYLLSVKPAGVAPGAVMQTDLTVLTPRVRTGLDTDHIAVLYPDRRLDYFAAARWSGPLDEVFQDLALQAFRAYGQFRNVHTDTSAFGAGYWLEIDVVDFQAEYSTDAGPPTAHVRVLGRVGTSRDRRIVDQFEADARQAAADNRLTAIVDAYNRAADTALAKIVEDTVEALKGNLSLEGR
jgi:ABC-type uncharacterized transport system auxiliary subunit